MAKDYWATFGSDPTVNSGLAPTFIIFTNTSGATLTPPAITEPLAGSGYYYFSYGPTLSTAFLLDGGGALASADRYVQGVLDPIQAVDQALGSTVSSFGSTSVDPGTAIGYLKRIQEFLEGNAEFNKTTGEWEIYSRGSSTLLRVKTLANSVGEVTKS